MSVLENVKPNDVFRYFEDICAIPHGSGNPAGINAYCVDFAKSHGLRYVNDEAGNVVIFKDGDPSKAPVILQGHMDMVCVKDPDSDHDFLKDGLKLLVEDDFVTADGTTLGGDDGIAVAMILAILADDTLNTPPIEAVFTMDEETSMGGAGALDTSVLSGKRMINLDSEAEGTFWVSCAGGVRATAQKALTFTVCDAPCYCATLKGLQGGHSGTEIDKGHLNAIRSLFSLLTAVKDVRIAAFRGGKVDNAIPSECTVLFSGSAVALQSAFAAVLPEWQKAEPGISLSVEAADSAPCLSPEDTQRLLAFIAQMPDGVQGMSADVPGLVETSLNLGQCAVDEKGFFARWAVRSNNDAEREKLCERLSKTAQKHEMPLAFTGAYPAWSFRKDSPLRDKASEVFASIYGKAPVIEAIHAGLECGLFSGKIPGLDCISMGPDMHDIHTPQEKLSISSTERSYRLVRKILEALD